jgi:MFS family permease
MQAYPTHYDRRLVWWLSATQLITWGSVFYGFGVLLAPVEQELGLSRAEASLAFSLGLLAEGVLAYPVGRWIDGGHERLVMTCGSLAVALGLALHGFVQGPVGFYAVWLLLGAALSATLYSPAFAVVTRRFPGDFRRAIITLTFLGGLASTVFIPLTAWLIDAYGWRTAVWVLAALHLAVCVPIHALVLRGAPPPAGAITASAASTASDGGAPTPAGIAPLLRSPAFLGVGLFVVLMMGVTTALPAHMVSLLRESGLEPAWAVGIPAAIGLMQVFGRLMLFFFEHHFDVHLANRLIPCLIPLGLLFLLAGSHAGPHPSPWLGLLFVGCYGVGNGMLTIVKGTSMAEYVSRTHFATLNGVLGLPSAIARAVAPLALGLWWSSEAGYTLGLWVMLGVSLVAVVALWLAQRTRLVENRVR